MAERPAVWTSRLTTPGAGAFALLFGLEAAGRALVTAALPIQSLRIMGSDEGVSLLFLLGSLASVSMAFLVPPVARWMGRARLCSLAILLIGGATVLFMLQDLPSQVIGFVLRASGVAILYAVLSMFIMDHIRRRELGRSEPLRMLSIGLAWTVGPVAGVQIEALWGEWAPFAASGLAALLLLGCFWTLRFSDLPIVRRAPESERPPESEPAPKTRGARPAARPFANLALFLRQPRLVLAWLHATGRGIFWITFVVYTPLYALEIGLGAAVGGTLVALGSASMILMPLWGWAARRYGIRRVSLWAFPLAALCSVAAFLLTAWPWVASGFLIAAAFAMSAIDGYGNALFFRACKPSQRAAMTPIFSAQRDLAAILQAGLFAVLLVFFPVQSVFLAMAVILIGQSWLALNINARL